MITYTADEYKKKFGEDQYNAVPSFNQNQPQPGIGSGIVNSFKQSGQDYMNAINGQGQYGGQSSIRRGTEAFANIASAPFKAAFTLPGLKQATGAIGAGVNWLTDKISNNEALQKWTAEHPKAYKALDEILGTTSAGGEIAGDILGVEGIKSGVVKTAGRASSFAKDATSGLANTGDEILSKVKAPDVLNPESIMQRVARISKGSQAKFKEISGESIGEYLNKRGIYGNKEEIATKLYDRFIKSKQTADEALAKLGGEYKPTPLKTALKELIDREKKVSTPGAFSNDFNRIKELALKYKSKGLNMSEINEVKRLYERNVRLDYLKQNLPDSVARANNIDSAIRKWQFNTAEKLGLKNLPKINKETQLSKTLLDAMGKESAGSMGNNAITLTDYILLAGGSPQSIAAFFGKKLLSSEKLQSAIAQKLYKGDKMENVGAEFGSPKPDLEDFNKKYGN